MSFQNASQQIQRTLLNRVQNDTRYKIIDALVDARRQNNSITETDLRYSEGKQRAFKMNYYPVVCDGEGDCSDTICDPGTVLEPKQAVFNITRCTASKVYRLNVDDIREVDDDFMFSDHARAQIASVMGSVRKALAQEMIALIVANVGCMPDAQPTRQLALTDPATGAIRPLGMWQIQQAFEDAGMANPYIVGGTDVFTWGKATQIGGLNQQGQNTGAFNNDNLFYDPLVDAAFGDPTQGHILAFNPQMLRLVTFSDNAGMFATDWTGLQDMDKQFKQSKNGTIKGSILDPVTGLIWDLNIRYEDCEPEGWTFQLRLKWDIFFLPDYVCNVDCLNGIFHFTTCLPTPVECSDVTPPAPITASTYEWTPGGIFPEYFGDITLGGQTTAINATAANITEMAALLNANIAGYTFSVSGSDIVYTGFSAISGSANGGTIEIEFTKATT